MTNPANPAEPAPEKSLLRRLSPYIAIAVIAAIVVIVLVVTGGGNGDDDGDDASVDTAPPAAEEPAVEDSTDEDDTNAGEGDTAAQAADEPEADDSTGSDDAYAGEGDTDTPEGDTSAEDDVTPAADPPEPDEPAEPEYPGIGSQAALDNPDCDPETGRIRIPILDAPPCVVEWPEGADNGGSTAPGVTADSIVMVVRVDAGQTEIIDDVGGIPRAWKDVVDIYNEHFELWGRQVQLEFIDSSGSSEVAQRADATRAVNDFKPFFTHDATTDGDGRAIFEAEMAARGVIVWGAIVSWQETQDQPGFRWSGLADGRVTLLHVLEYVGKRVAGDPVQWAGDDSLIGEPRRIGMVYTDRWDRDFIDEQAALQGFELVEAVSYDEGAESTQRQERARVIAARMKDAGVTTVIAGTDNLFTGTLTKAATEQQWFPEWIITGYGAHDAAFFARGYDQEQWAHAFGPGPIGLRVDGESTAYQLMFEWHHGRPPGSLAANQALSVVRWPLTCIHLTGPNLTPESFSEGCFSMPPTGGAYCDCVTTTGATFGDSLLPWTDYTAFDDMAEKWWDPTFEYTTPSGFTQVGAYLVVDGGRRYAVGGWPDGQPDVFDPDAAVFRLADYPPNEVLPSYER